MQRNGKRWLGGSSLKRLWSRRETDGASRTFRRRLWPVGCSFGSSSVRASSFWTSRRKTWARFATLLQPPSLRGLKVLLPPLKRPQRESSHLDLSASSIDPEAIARMKELWMLKHRHQHEGPRKVGDGKLTTVIKDLLVQKLESKARV